MYSFLCVFVVDGCSLLVVGCGCRLLFVACGCLLFVMVCHRALPPLVGFVR